MAPRPPSSLNVLPDNAIVSPSEAGLFIHRDAETLRRWRRSGIGPRWLTHPMRDDGAEYRMGDLRSWIDQRRFSHPANNH